MATIQNVLPEQADGRVKEIYQEIEHVFGRVPNAFRAYSSSPELLAQQWMQGKYYMQHPTLGFPLLAMIRMLVSQENECPYCVGMNAAMLIQRAGLTPDQISAVKRNPEDAPLDEKDKAMLLLVLKATKHPRTVGASDLHGLRALGWNDGEILEAVHHGARNIAVDVVFNTFKVEQDF